MLKINRLYIPTYGADSKAIRHGLKWLLNGNERLVIHVPSMEQIHGGSVLTNEIGRPIIREFQKTGILEINAKKITVITDRKLPEITENIRILSCWPMSDSLEKLERTYQISDVLVIPWDFRKDIEKWKLKYLPDIFQEYTPSPPQEF
ncbi:MAG: hypothetical protein R3327_04785 [Nitrosopumilaceae archaeon]|nr:hypothetical protein [Nitrosopumilaceae archaeon]